MNEYIQNISYLNSIKPVMMDRCKATVELHLKAQPLWFEKRYSNRYSYHKKCEPADLQPEIFIHLRGKS
jgi:hypothetical protein